MLWNIVMMWLLLVGALLFCVSAFGAVLFVVWGAARILGIKLE